MAAIVCSRVEDVDQILYAYQECKKIGLRPLLLIRPELQDTSFSPMISSKLQGQIDVVMMPEKAEEIHSSFFNNRYIIITIGKEPIRVPHPYHQLRLTESQAIVSKATITGFAQVKTFPPSFGEDLCRELLSCSLPSFITSYDNQTFIWNGGLTPANTLGVKIDRTLPPAITGISSIIRILPLTNWTTTDHLIQEWGRFCEGTNIQLVKTNPDYFLVINSTTEQVDPRRTIYFMMEPYGERLFAEWIKRAPKLFFLGSHRHHLNNVEWHLTYSTPSLKSKAMPSNRVRGLCAIVSSRCTDPGQKYRLEVVKVLDSMLLPFPFHIYGQCAELQFRNYKGELPRISKEQALEKYQYNLICENNEISNYITEKLYDGILCETYTFYKGAPNVHSFFHPHSFGLLTGNLSTDIRMIIESIQADVYPTKLPKIKEMKEKILTQWSLPVRLNSIIELAEALVLVRYPSQHHVMTHHTAIGKQLQDQSFHHTAQGVFEKDSNWLQQVVQTSLNQERGIIVINYSDITDHLYQTLINVIHLESVDLFTLTPDIQSGIQYIRLKGAEKIMINLTSQQSPLTGITKCIFTV